MTWDELIRSLRGSGALTPSWEPAFRALPRERFTPARVHHDGEWIDRAVDPDRWAELVCSDLPLTTQLYAGTATPSSSSSMPTVVALMLGHLDVVDGMRVLEVGTGTGWTAGLLAHRLGDANVVSIELDRDLAGEARTRLAGNGLRPRLIAGDGMLGDPDGAPFQRVHLTAAVRRLPGALIEQCAPGGVILAPYGTAFCNGALARLTVAADGESASGPFVADVAFMWVRDQRPDSGEFEIEEIRYGASEVDPVDFADDTDAAFAIGLRMPELYRQSVWATYDRFGTGRSEVWDGVSYAHCRLADWQGAHAVSQSGPRNLWDEVTATYRWWKHHGRPDLTRFGLTVTTAGEHLAWLDEPDHVIG